MATARKSILMDDRLVDLVNNLAKEDHRSFNTMITVIVENYFNLRDNNNERQSSESTSPRTTNIL